MNKVDGLRLYWEYSVIRVGRGDVEGFGGLEFARLFYLVLCGVCYVLVLFREF